MAINGEGYSPAGRASIFDVPAYDDVADLNVLFKNFADTTASATGDTLTGAYTLNGSPIVTEGASQTLTNKSFANPVFTGTITGLPSPDVVVATKTASYTVTADDAHKLFVLSSATALQLLIPTDAAVALAVGTTFSVIREGAGAVSFAAVSAGTTSVQGSPGLALRAQYSMASIIKIAANTWRVAGDVIP